MKTWMLALSLIAVLGFSGLADAKGAKHGKAIKGSITAVNGAKFTMTTTPSKKDPNANVETYTVDTATATVTGGTLAVGQNVSVTGNLSGKDLAAITVKIAGKHHKKKPA